MVHKAFGNVTKMSSRAKAMWTRASFASRAAVGDRRLLEQIDPLKRGHAKERHPPNVPATTEANPLQAFFEARTVGRGIYKWDHYFDIYHRHFERFVGRQPHVLEIGIYSGGSLDMWSDYFAEGCRIYGVDINPACAAYESDSIRVFIGDQTDRAFWKRFRAEVPIVDIVIDDGGHTPEQQRVTLEELLPHLQPGGVYACEDVHHSYNAFASYVHLLGHKLNAANAWEQNSGDKERFVVCKATEFQSAVRSICLYPFVTVIERRDSPMTELFSSKHGTEWQP